MSAIVCGESRGAALLGGFAVELEDRVGVEGARRLLAGERRLVAWWRALTGRADRGAARLELVYLPVAVTGTLPRIYVADRVLGSVWAVSYQPEGSPPSGPVERAALPPRLAVEDCVRPLQALATRAASTHRRGRRLDLAELAPPRAATYPFWLRYRRGRRGRFAFDALDAVTGQRPGSALHAALATALIDAEAASVSAEGRCGGSGGRVAPP